VILKRVYPDTPVALHYRPFEEIDWCAAVEADEVVLVITPVFLREVDEHKDHKRGALQQRARRMNAWLGELRKTKNWTIRPGVRVEVSAREPERDVDFAAHGLEPSVNDDKIIACMLRDTKAAPDVPLVCVTPDNALAFKADAAGFEVVAPPEEARLPDEPDAAEREKRELLKEILELKKRIGPEADLAVRLEGGKERVTIGLSGLEAPTEADLDEEIQAERAALDLRHRLIPLVVQRPPSAKAVERYFAELRAWMLGTTKVAVKHAHTFNLKFVLVNEGLGNASDIAIDLSFPDTVFTSETRQLPDVAERPTAPEPEEHSFATARIPTVPPDAFPRLRFGQLRRREPVRLDAEVSDPHRVRVLVDLAKHQSNIVLPPFQAWFKVGQRPTGFSIAYRIHAASTPNIKTGTLHVKVEVREGPFSFLRSELGRPIPAEQDGDANSESEKDDVPENMDVPDHEQS